MGRYDLSQTRLEAARQYVLTAIAAAGGDPLQYAPGTLLYDKVVAPLIMATSMLQQDAQRLGYYAQPGNIDKLDPDDQQEAMALWASQWLIDPPASRPAKSVVELDLTTRSSVVVALTDTFTTLDGRVFVLDAQEALNLRPSQLRVALSPSGESIYRAVVPVVARVPGAAGSARAQALGSTTVQVQGLAGSRLAQDAVAQDADLRPSTFLARARDAMSHRMPVTPRAVRRLGIESGIAEPVVVVSAGDPEMQRDIPQLVPPRAAFHVFGKTDVYVAGPVIPTTRAARVGDFGSTADASPMVIRDTDLSRRGVDLRCILREGMCIRFHNAAYDEPSVVRIGQVSSQCLVASSSLSLRRKRPTPLVSKLSQVGVSRSGDTITFHPGTSRLTSGDVGRFVHIGDSAYGTSAQITEVLGAISTGYYESCKLDFTAQDLSELATEDLQASLWDGQLVWSAGTNAPDYDNVVSSRTTGYIDDQIMVDGCIVLPGKDVVRVHSVVCDSDDLGQLDVVTGQWAKTTQVAQSQSIAADDGTFSVTRRDWSVASSTRDCLFVRAAGGDIVARGPGDLVYLGEGVVSLTDTSSEFTAQDVGRRFLILEPGHQANAAAYTVTSVLSLVEVQAQRTSAPLVPGQDLLSETDVTWAWDDAGSAQGIQVQVTYDVCDASAALRPTVEAESTRALGADTLVRSCYYAYVELVLTYARRPDAASTISSAQIAQAAADFVAQFPSADVLHLDDICSHLRQRFEVIGEIHRASNQTRMRCTLMVPSGDLVALDWSDAIRVTAAAADASNQARLDAEVRRGLTSRLVVPILRAADVTVVQVEG